MYDLFSTRNTQLVELDGLTDNMAWTTPQYSRQEVNAAGKTVASMMMGRMPMNSMNDWLRYEEAVGMINNWRTAHGHPLNVFQTNLRRVARRIDGDSLVAQRTKRLYSIALKLSRFPKMKLSQMQDIGGCRCVLSSVNLVQKIAHHYLEESQIKHRRSTVDDYIGSPKKSGYRGVHIVYRFHSSSPRTSIYNDMKIEIQLRSQYQHAWATAVETVGTFVRESLKSSIGSDEWLRFFSIMGSVIALRENTPIVPETPSNYNELLSELRHHAETLRVSERLRAYGQALRTFETQTQDASIYLLELNPSEDPPKLEIKGFKLAEAEEAAKQYSDAEKIAREREGSGSDAVLVSVDSLAALPRAYPNYFADTQMFVALLEQELKGSRRRVPKSTVSIGT